jgi:putative methyltransferase
MQNQGKVTAFDISSRRLETLQLLTNRTNCTAVEPRNQSFLDVDPFSEEFANVTHILLDPSCSGSGIVSRLDHLMKSLEENPENENDPLRLENLATFQKNAILHAMKCMSRRFD